MPKDEIVLVMWHTESGSRAMIAFENQARADAFMNAHPYRDYFYTTLDINQGSIKSRPKTYFAE